MKCCQTLCWVIAPLQNLNWSNFVHASLCSGSVIPAKVEIPSLRIIQEVGQDDAKWIRSMHIIDEKIMDGQLYQNRITKAINKKVRPRQFSPGQLVLKRILPHQDEAKGKFAPNCQSPYMVHRVLFGGALDLAETDGQMSTKPINSDAVKSSTFEANSQIGFPF